ncbi:hypothetical protein [Amycolatopsis suaedae]|uniref:hypothetical protein n=1 Tax=Amycolatopsis suaedae TaxID=2510978 RepID=UPI0013EF4E87|nr:hypothetical protein [Amycolatopsis suaedae]
MRNKTSGRTSATTAVVFSHPSRDEHVARPVDNGAVGDRARRLPFSAPAGRSSR